MDYIYPAGGCRGETIKVTAGGKFDPWPATAWTDASGLVFSAEKEAGSFTVKIQADVPLGIHQVRVYNADGVSAIRTFVIGGVPEIMEKEPNDDFRQPQVITNLPVTINGRLEKSGDLDSFAVKVEAGKWLVAAVDGYSLGSPIDPFLHLLDTDGRRIAFANDSANFDPVLAWKAEKSGTYIIQIAAFAHPPAADVRFAGSASSVYRLTITDGPYVNHAIPAGMQYGQKTKVRLVGWNLGKETSEIEVPAQSSGADHYDLVAPGAGKPLRLVLGTAPEVNEHEPNNSTNEAQRVTVPRVVNGCIQPAGDVDRFSFAAKKDERFEFRVRSGSLGFLLDGVLKVEDASGGQFARSEMRGEAYSDPRLDWAAPADGIYHVSISDLEHRGGPDYAYRLEMSHPEPDFTVTVDNHAYRVEAGKTNEIKLSVTRVNGHKEKLKAEVKGLPEGITVSGGDIADKSGEVKLALKPPEDAKPFNGPIRVEVVAEGEKEPRSRVAHFNLKDKDAPGDLLLNESGDLWLTITDKPVEPETAKKKKK